MNASVCIERMRQMSSAQVARCGRYSESSMPHWPCGRNSRWLASTAAVGLMNASCRFFVSDSGSGLPFHFCSSGLGSNRSSWLGPPSIKRNMTFFALGANCGSFGASGLAEGSVLAPRPSRSSRLASAIVPMPPAQSRKKLRRLWIFRNCCKVMIYSRVINSSRFSKMRLSPTQSGCA